MRGDTLAGEIEGIMSLFTNLGNDLIIVLVIFGILWVSAVLVYRNKYKKTAESIVIATISNKGKISEWVDPEVTGQRLRGQITNISNSFKQGRSPHSSHYMEQTLGADLLGVKSISVNASKEIVPKETLQQIDVMMQKSGKTRFKNIIDVLKLMFSIVPVFYKKKYLNSLYHISLIHQGNKVHLTVYKGKPSRKMKSDQLEETDSSVNIRQVRVEDMEVKGIDDLEDVLKTVACFVLEIDKKSFPGRDGRSIRSLVDGLDALDTLERTGNNDKLIEAKKRFSKITKSNDPPTQYFYACLFLIERKEKSINLAIKLFNNGLTTENPKLKALCHTGLANCYAQRVHRLAGDETDLERAEEHAKKAEIQWKKTQSGKLHPWIYTTKALIKHVDEGTEETRDFAVERFVKSAQMYLEAIQMEPENGALRNNIGWVLLKLAEWGAKPLEVRDGIPESLIGDPAKNAEKYFKESLEFNSKNRLTNANLCLLYASPYFREMDPDKYLNWCRFYGQKAIKIQPSYINGYRDLTVSLILYGKYDEAYENYLLALSHSKDMKKDQEIMDDAKNVLLKVNASEDELKRWENPPEELLLPPDIPGSN
jgi:tetratricopeptide (TPR) repeat protein